MAETSNRVDNTSADYNAMSGYWVKVASVLAGIDAIREQPQFLPQFPNESDADYKFRQKHSKLTNVFGDIVETLSTKPFSREVAIANEAPPSWATELVEDIDGKGNHLTVFAQDFFYGGIADAINWILVEFPRAENGQTRTRADEQRAGVRPYWVRIDPRNLIAIETARINGQEEFVHVRMREDRTKRDGYREERVERIRVIEREKIADNNYGPPTFKVFEKQSGSQSASDWVEVDQGTMTIEQIPLVPFLTGRRLGAGWRIKPVLRDAIDLQIDLYQQESGLKYAKEATAFPMLTGNGVQPQLNEDGTVKSVPVGPKAVLYAPMGPDGNHGEWSFIEPSAESLTFLSNDIDTTKDDLRELGRQPLTAQTGNITVVTATFAGDKANSVIQAWSFNLKDALENAFDLTGQWINQSEDIEVFVNTDLSIGIADEVGPKALAGMRSRGDISLVTYWDEMKRRGILSPEFDPEVEAERIAEELPEEIDEEGRENAV